MFPIVHERHLPRSPLLYQHFSISNSLGVFSRELVTFPLHPLNLWTDLPISVLLAGEPTHESSEVKFPSLYVLFASTLLNRLFFFLQSIILPSPLFTLDLKAAQHAQKTFQKFWMATMVMHPSEVPCLESSLFCLQPCWVLFIFWHICVLSFKDRMFPINMKSSISQVKIIRG